MELNIDEQQLSQMVADGLVKKLTPVIEMAVKKYEQPDELLEPQELCDQVLHCHRDTLDNYFVYQPGFPSMNKGTRKVYSLKAVEKWISTHQIIA
ncbi:DNA-binding protein [Levilactobacillus wangkuiensis]|uniref:DNA-binding protein n=1 Tax=Levilactobacillus wangkuiensis TaxID=2799566 RepID=UPI001951F785|nr:DNA-binding protein [Levilactobacillus wangkuiensis]